MTGKGLEILLVEDNANDELLTLHAFKRRNLANKIYVVRDGAEALEYLFCTGAYAERPVENPKLILLDNICRSWTAWKYCARFAPTRART
jgi:two-component system, response regulator